MDSPAALKALKKKTPVAWISAPLLSHSPVASRLPPPLDSFKCAYSSGGEIQISINADGDNGSFGPAGAGFPMTVSDFLKTGAGKERRVRGWKCCSAGGAATNEESEKNLPSAGRPLNREIRGKQEREGAS